MNWDSRYAGDDYLFGREHAQFFDRNADLLPSSGTALCIADGEGRNSVWLARRGLTVTAWDASEVALRKARALATEAGVSVDYQLADAEGFDWDAVQYDLVAGIFFQFADPDLRATMFEGLIRAVRPGGMLAIHGYTPKQVAYGTGGPPQAEHMYTEEMLRQAFGALEIVKLEAYDAHIEEGTGHSGVSALIDLIARR